MRVIIHNKLAASADVSPTVHVSSKLLSALLINACNRRAGKAHIHIPLRNTLSSFFSALEQELLLDDVLELWVELVLAEALRLRELVAFLCLFRFLSFLALFLRPFPIELDTQNYNEPLPLVLPLSSTIKRLQMWKVVVLVCVCCVCVVCVVCV